MKKLSIIILILLVIFYTSTQAGFCNGKGNNYFEQSPPICTTSPEFIDNYLEDTIDLINTTKTDGKLDGNYLEKLKGLGAKALQPVIGGITIMGVFSFGALEGFFQNFYIIFKEQHIVRDWIKLTNFKQYITKIFLNQSKNGKLSDSLKEIDKIKQKIQQGKYFLIKFKGNSNLDLYKYIWKNHTLIEYIYFNKLVKSKNKEEIINGLKKALEEIPKTDEEYDILNTKENTSYIGGLNKAKVENIIKEIKKNYYKGSNIIKCDTNWKKFVFNMKNIICNFGKKELDKVSERFSCNYARLKDALNLGGAGKKFACGSVQLKESIPWKDRLKTNIRIEGVGKITSTAEIIKKFKDSVSKELKRYSNSLSNLFTYKKINISPSVSEENFKFNEITQTIKGYEKNVLEEESIAKNIFTKVEPGKFTHNTTYKFPKISKKIYEIRKKLELVEKYTVKACKNQSPNIGECKSSESKTSIGE